MPVDARDPETVALLDALTSELAPEHRGTGVADALITALIVYAHDAGTDLLRLETGDKQRAAIAFYRRHGFVEVARFGPYVHSATSVCMQATYEAR